MNMHYTISQAEVHAKLDTSGRLIFGLMQPRPHKEYVTKANQVQQLRKNTGEVV